MISLGYATVGSNKLDQAKKFYDALFEPHGVKSAFEHPSGGRVYGKDGKLFFGVLGPYDKKPATPGNGTMVALNLGSRDEVNAFHAKALELGGPTKARRVNADRVSISRISAISTATSSAPTTSARDQALAGVIRFIASGMASVPSGT